MLPAVLLVALLAVFGAGSAALAAADDRSAAETLLREAEASARKDVALDFITRARAALDRGARLRAEGHLAHAKLADSLARTWATAARDVAHAAVIEQSATAARESAADAGTLAEREHALLEEAIAQSGRLRAQLDSVERADKELPSRTSTAIHSSDAGSGGANPSQVAPKVDADGGAR